MTLSGRNTAQRVRHYSPEPILRHPGRILAELARDILRGRGLAWRLFIRDLSAQYRQTYFGYLWVFLPPLAASFAFIYLQRSGIVAIDSGGISYPLFALTGTLLWQVLVDAVASPSGALHGAKPMLAKINFPREAVFMAGLYMVGFNLAVRLLLLAVILGWWGVMPTSALAMLPMALMALVVLGFAVGLIISPLSGLYGDVMRALPIVAQFWMLLTPVVYPLSRGGMLADVVQWNPATPLIVTARQAVMGDSFTHLPEFWIVFATSGVVALAGLVLLRVAMPHVIARVGG